MTERIRVGGARQQTIVGTTKQVAISVVAVNAATGLVMLSIFFETCAKRSTHPTSHVSTYCGGKRIYRCLVTFMQSLNVLQNVQGEYYDFCFWI